MKTVRMLSLLVALAVPVVAAPASAGPCATVGRATTCVAHSGCLLYRDPGNPHQSPLCV